MAANHQPPIADGPADQSMLEDIVDAGWDYLIQSIATAEGALRGMKLPSVGELSRFVGDRTKTVVKKLQQPITYRVEVRDRPLWMHILGAILLVLLAHKIVPNLGAHKMGPTLQESSETCLPTHAPTPPTPEPAIPTPQPAYDPAEVGIVEEICFLISEISAQTARAPGAQTLYEFVDSGVGHGGSSLQKLCGACSASEVRRFAVIDSGGKGGRSAWDEAEDEQRLLTMERAIVVTSDQESAAIYQRLFVDGAESETYHQTRTRINLHCAEFWY